MPSNPFTRALCALLLISSLTYLASSSARAVDSPPKPADTRGLILSHLPAADSPAYEVLKRAAGVSAGHTLDMTGAEMWSVASDRVQALKSAATAQGVGVMELDENWNRALAPMDASAPMTEAQQNMMHEAMSSPAAMGVTMMALPDPMVMEYALTNDGGGTEPAAELTIALNGTTTVKVKRTSVEKTAEGYIWHGVVDDGTDDAVTLLWWPSGRLSGQITHLGHHYVVKPMGGTMHGVVEMAPKMLPPEHAPMGKALQNKMHMREDPLVTKGDASMLRKIAPGDSRKVQEPVRNLQDASPSPAKPTSKDLALLTPPSPTVGPKPADVTITMLVAYTRQAASHYTDIVKDLIELAVEEANQSFRNSGIENVHLKLVYTYQTDYVESGTHFEHVFRFADKGDGYMDEVHALRDEHKADIAVLIVHDPNGCGLSAAVAPAADRAFSVVHHECAAVSYSLTHEIGHLIGARHDIGLDDSKEPYPFGHGFVFGTKWRTMMSYKESCDDCQRLPIWSNPRTLVHGVAAGDATSDNARVISEGAARVAAFR